MICKRKIDKLDFIKIKNFFSVKDPTKRIKKKQQQATDQDKIFQNYIFYKGLISGIYKEFLLLNS